jgi:hypothetical protein
MPTSNVSTTSPGTSPFVVDVSACNLLEDLSVKDFQVFVGGSLSCSGLGCTSWAKTTSTQLTYSGTAIANATTIQIRRKTPNSVIQAVSFAQRFSSGLWNSELDRLVRWREEADLNGVGSGSTTAVALPVNDPYPTGWDGDTISPPTRNSVADALTLFARLSSPNFTDVPTAPTPPDNSSTNQIANTAFVSTRVTNALSNSPALGGNPTATTQPQGNSSNRIATTSFAQTLSRPVFSVAKDASQQTIAASGSSATITWENEIIDSDGAFSSNQFTVPAGLAGTYFFTGTVYLSATTASAVSVRFSVNGTNVRRLYETFITTESITAGFGGGSYAWATVLPLAAADVCSVRVTLFFGSNLRIGFFTSNAPEFLSTWSGFRLSS